VDGLQWTELEGRPNTGILGRLGNSRCADAARGFLAADGARGAPEYGRRRPDVALVVFLCEFAVPRRVAAVQGRLRVVRAAG
jgi:hypothetical protein